MFWTDLWQINNMDIWAHTNTHIHKSMKCADDTFISVHRRIEFKFTYFGLKYKNFEYTISPGDGFLIQIHSDNRVLHGGLN